ncbi:MAG: hypothetical protein ACYTGB_05160 [Planctomycetota bacterium]|jgi:hypothetical protein
MRVIARLCSISLVGLLLLALPAAAGEDATEDHRISGKAAKELAEKLEAERDRLKKHVAAEVGKFETDLNKKFEDATKPNTFKVKVGDREEEVEEPRDPKDVKRIPSKRFRVWSIRPSDFRFDLPVEVFVPRVVGPTNLIGKDKVYLVLPFEITNTLVNVDIRDNDGKLIGAKAVNSDEELAKIKAVTEKDGNTLESKPGAAPLNLRFTMMTDKGELSPEASGFLAHEAVEFSTWTRRAWTKELVSFVRQSKVVGELKPGETRSGVAVFPRFDPEATEVRVLVDGMSNEYDFARDLRKVMILEFVRPGNVYYPGQVKLAFKRRVGGKLMDPKTGYVPKKDMEVHHGFDWVWLWNWDAAAKTSDPKCTEGVPSPTGKEKFNFWTYQVTIPNRTGKEQVLTVEKVRTFVKVTLNIAGKDRVVEVPLVDDGKMNVYKALHFENEGLDFAGDRFPSETKLGTGGDAAAEFTVCFRENDVDFGAVLRNVHSLLDLDLAKERNVKGKDDPDAGRKAAFEGPKQLSLAEVNEVRKQLAEKVHDAIKAQLAENAWSFELTVKSGLSSGVRTVNFSLYKPVPLPPPPGE